MNYLVIEDEFYAAKRIERLVQGLRPKANCVGSVDSVEDAIEWFRTNPSPHLALADIQLADGLSFSIFENVEVSCPVIFTTAFDQYAIRAFKENSVDYLLKPVDQEELEVSLNKFDRAFNKQSPFDAEVIHQLRQSIESPEYVQRFLIKLHGGLSYVNITDLAYFYSDHGMTYGMTKSGKKHVVDYTLEQVKDLVDPGIFFRISRKLIVHIQAVEIAEDYFNSRLAVKLNPTFKGESIVSRERVKAFKQWIGK